MKPFTIFLATTTLTMSMLPAFAQTGGGGRRMVTLRLADAGKVASAAMDAIRRKSGTGAVAVVDAGGNLICLERADNTPPASANIALGKAHTAAAFKRPTRDLEEKGKGRHAPTLGLKDYSPVRGGVPIVMDGQVVGAVGVGGAATADLDQAIAVESAHALEGGAAAGSARELPVTYFDKETVAAAFAKAAILFAGTDRNYTVMTGNRDKQGIAEIHTRNTDVFYVTEGTATFVTGGAVPDAKNFAPDELRGSRIVGGQPRTLTKGDVIIIPAGIPHWFESVTPPFSYFVVKVR